MTRIGMLLAALALAAAAHAQAPGGPPDWLQELSLTRAQQKAVFRIFYEHEQRAQVARLHGDE
jgi:hypothetical protein